MRSGPRSWHLFDSRHFKIHPLDFLFVDEISRAQNRSFLSLKSPWGPRIFRRLLLNRKMLSYTDVCAHVSLILVWADINALCLDLDDIYAQKLFMLVVSGGFTQVTCWWSLVCIKKPGTKASQKVCQGTLPGQLANQLAFNHIIQLRMSIIVFYKIE